LEDILSAIIEDFEERITSLEFQDEKQEVEIEELKRMENEA